MELDEGPLHSARSTAAASEYVRSKKRGLWGAVLRATGIVTTVASVAVATGAAVFAAAAINTVCVCVCVYLGGRRCQHGEMGGRCDDTATLSLTETVNIVAPTLS